MMWSLLRRPTTTPTPEEDRLLLAAAQTGCIASRNELIERHLPYMLHYCRHRPRCAWMTRDDMVHECVLGTIRAIDRYRPDKARGRFMQYAQQWMRDGLNKARNFGALWRVPLTVQHEYRAGKLSTPRKQKTRAAVESFRPLERWTGTGDWDPPDNRLDPAETAMIHEYEEANYRRGVTRAAREAGGRGIDGGYHQC